MSEKKEDKKWSMKKILTVAAFLGISGMAMGQNAKAPSVKHKKVDSKELSVNALKRVKAAESKVKITEAGWIEDDCKLADNISAIRKDFDFEKSAQIAQQLGMKGEMKAYRIGTNTAFAYNADGFMLYNFETGEAVSLKASEAIKEGKLDNYIISRRDADKPETKQKGNELAAFSNQYNMDFYPDANNLKLAEKFGQPFKDRYLLEAYVIGMEKDFPGVKSLLAEGIKTYDFDNATGYKYAGQMNKASSLIKGARERTPDI